MSTQCDMLHVMSHTIHRTGIQHKLVAALHLPALHAGSRRIHNEHLLLVEGGRVAGFDQCRLDGSILLPASNKGVQNNQVGLV